MTSEGLDYKQHYVIADGCIDIPLLRPYARFIRWCEESQISLFVFGWDWRRGVREAANFFLQTFLPKFDARFRDWALHPLDNCTLLGHSSGGMVTKLIMNQADNAYVQRFKRAITIGTPFYGYGGQIRRFLKGEPALNWMAGFGRARAVVRIMSSMPGAYEFLHMDRETYDVNCRALAADPEGFNLLAYPSMDREHRREAADPYDPDSDKDGMVRYPANYGFSKRLLGHGKAVSREVSRPLPDNAASKFYCIRGVQSAKGEKLSNTTVGQIWGRISPDFDPNSDRDPIVDVRGYGDGVQPAWGARLLGLPDRHVITVVDDINHITMLNSRSVQRRIAELLGLGTNR